MKNLRVKYIVKIGLLSALSVIVMLFEFPLVFIAPSFYELDLSEAVIMMGGFAMGPLAAALMELVKNVLNILINGTTTGFVGEFANFITGCCLTVPAALVYKYRKSLKGALVGMAIGIVSLAVVGGLINYYVMLPMYSAFMPLVAVAIIYLVMVIFFVCLLLTGIVSFNVGGFSGSVVEMPNFENYRKDDAYIAQVAEKYGLHITLQPASSAEIAKDVIFEQNVAPGTKIAKGSDVTLTYSKGASTVTLPNFTGVPFTETVYYLGKLNLSYNIVEKANTGGQTPGHVASMSPAAGSIVYEGTEITIEIWGDPASSQDITGPNTGSQITSSDSIIDSILGSLSDSVSGLGSTIQSFFG